MAISWVRKGHTRFQISFRVEANPNLWAIRRGGRAGGGHKPRAIDCRYFPPCPPIQAQLSDYHRSLVGIKLYCLVTR